MKVTAAGADFVDECPVGVVCRYSTLFHVCAIFKLQEAGIQSLLLVICSCFSPLE